MGELRSLGGKKEVWKFEVRRYESVRMPFGAQLLYVALEGERIMVWALVDVRADPVDRLLLVVGTGEDVPPRGVYVGTVRIPIEGAHVPFLVLHVFDYGVESRR